MRNFILIYFALLIPFNFTYAQWENDVRLTDDPSVSSVIYGHSKAIAASGDTVHVVWDDGRDGNLEIYYKRSLDGGLTWGTDVRLTNNGPDTSRSPSISINGNMIHIAWIEKRDGNYEIYYKRSTDGGDNWGTDTRLTNDTSRSYNPTISVSGSNIHILWVDSRDGVNGEIYYKRSTDDGNNWSADYRLTSDSSFSYNPSICTNGSNVYVAFSDNRIGNSETFFKRSIDNGSTWSNDTNLSNNPFASVTPSISATDMFIYVVWTDNRNGNFDIYYKNSSNGGISWSNDKQITIDTSNSYLPNVTAYTENVHIIWMDRRDGFDQVYYNKSTDNGVTWDSMDNRLSQGTGFSQRPTICVSGTTVHTVWMDTRDGNYEIYYKRNPTGNSVGVVNISNEIPAGFSLSQNYPNPFNPSTKIKFDVSIKSNVKLIVYDINGRKINDLVNENLNAGSYEVEFNAGDLSSGVYYYRLIANGNSLTKKMILLK